MEHPFLHVTFQVGLSEGNRPALLGIREPFLSFFMIFFYEKPQPLMRVDPSTVATNSLGNVKAIWRLKKMIKDYMFELKYALST